MIQAAHLACGLRTLKHNIELHSSGLSVSMLCHCHSMMLVVLVVLNEWDEMEGPCTNTRKCARARAHAFALRILNHGCEISQPVPGVVCDASDLD